MKKIKSLAPILIFMIGAGIFLYPTIANSLALYQQSSVIYNYDTKLSESRQEEIDEAWSDAVIYNDNLAGDPVHDPFVPNSGYALPDNYLNVLNLSGDGVMGYIKIPQIDVELPIYHGTTDEVLKKGAGHIEGTSLPIGGNFRHSVISGHRGLPSAELFSDLDELSVGDEFYIRVLDKDIAYKIDQIETVDPKDINKYISAEEGKDMVTLMTCTPYGINTHRLLIRGVRTDYVQEDETILNDSTEKSNMFYILGLLVFAIIVIFVYSHKRSKK